MVLDPGCCIHLNFVGARLHQFQTVQRHTAWHEGRLLAATIPLPVMAEYHSPVLPRPKHQRKAAPKGGGCSGATGAPIHALHPRPLATTRRLASAPPHPPPQARTHLRSVIQSRSSPRTFPTLQPGTLKDGSIRSPDQRWVGVSSPPHIVLPHGC